MKNYFPTNFFMILTCRWCGYHRSSWCGCDLFVNVFWNWKFLLFLKIFNKSLPWVLVVVTAAVVLTARAVVIFRVPIVSGRTEEALGVGTSAAKCFLQLLSFKAFQSLLMPNLKLTWKSSTSDAVPLGFKVVAENIAASSFQLQFH